MMSNTIALPSFSNDLSSYISRAQAEDIFVYPTDTIYGIGAIVTPSTITQINKAKQRLPGKHYSIIAPSFDWIYQHFHAHRNIEKKRKERKDRFPERGLTLLLPLDNSQENTLDRSLLSATDTIGVRLLDHPFQEFVTRLGQPFITSSCNISGIQPITRIDQIPSELAKSVDIIIDGGTLDGTPSVVIDYLSGTIIRT